MRRWLGLTSRVSARACLVVNCYLQRVRRLGPYCWCELTITARVLPQPECDWNGIDIVSLPPCGFVSGAMQLAVMEPADRDDELVAHSPSEGTRLGKREVVRVRRNATAHEAGLP